MQQKDRKPIQPAVLLFSILTIMAAYRSNVIIPRSSSVFAMVLCIKDSNDFEFEFISPHPFTIYNDYKF